MKHFDLSPSTKYFYFAYGSNMDLSQMDERCGQGYKVIKSAVLDGWEFFINTRGVANLILDDKSKVYGLLFEITEDCLKCLDLREGRPTIYNREELGLKNGKRTTKAWVYIDKNFIKIGTPRINYLERIIKSAHDFEFPNSYIEHLKSFGKK